MQGQRDSARFATEGVAAWARSSFQLFLDRSRRAEKKQQRLTIGSPAAFDTGDLMPTVSQWFFAVTLLAALGCGLIAGVFFAFSTFVMQALDRLPPGEGMAAMQSINVVVLNPMFLGAFLGTAVLCVVALIFSFLHWNEASAIYLSLGSVLYLVGTLFVTIAFNVPRNNALALLAPTDPNASQLWARYISSWTRWNHVRTAAAVAAAAAFT